MQYRGCYAGTLVLLFIWLFSSHSNEQAAVTGNPDLAGSPYDVISAVNALRDSYRLTPYSISPTLMITAQAHADYMAATGIVSHTGAGGSSVTDRLLAAGYPLAGDLSLGGFRSENITSGPENMAAQAAVNQWTGDALHLSTMISPSLSEIGAGISVSGGRAYYVIDCAQPTMGEVPPMPGVPVTGEAGTGGVRGATIPVVVVTPNANGEIVHEVKAGQTLWQIAIAYETRIDEIKRLNRLYGDDIYPGMRLLVKKEVLASPTVLTETATPILAPTVLPVLPSTLLSPTSMSAPIQPKDSSISTRSIAGYVIAIVVIALLGGGLFMWLGTVKRE